MTPSSSPLPTDAAKSGVTTNVADGCLTLVFKGDWSIGHALPAPESFKQVLGGQPRPTRLAFDASALKAWDSRFLVFCSRLGVMAAAAGLEIDTKGLPEGAVRLIALAAKAPPRKGAAREKVKEPLTVRVGDAALGLVSSANGVLAFLGEVTMTMGRFFRGRAVFPMDDLMALIKTNGLDALPIVSLISLLVGLILAYVSAVQLEAFGAEIYTATLVGIAMVRVLSAVMTGIIMAGRTGAAFAAELGTMQVNEEIDALRTFGVDPIEFLVLPRMLALTIMMPLLCIYADFMGILGGFIVGVTFLHINPLEYLEFTKSTLPLVNFWIGLTHSLVFGVLVSMAGCYQGIRCGRSALAVGQATTSAVVASIVSIIVATSILTILCNILGI